MHVQRLWSIPKRLENAEVGWEEVLCVEELGALLRQGSWVSALDVAGALLQVELVLACLKEEVLNALHRHEGRLGGLQVPDL